LESVPRTAIVRNSVRQVLRTEQRQGRLPLCESSRSGVTSVEQRTVVNVVRLAGRGERGVLPGHSRRDVDARVNLRCRRRVVVSNARDWNNPDRHITVARKLFFSDYATTEK